MALDLMNSRLSRLPSSTASTNCAYLGSRRSMIRKSTADCPVKVSAGVDHPLERVCQRAGGTSGTAVRRMMGPRRERDNL